MVGIGEFRVFIRTRLNVEPYSHKNPEFANSYHENPQNRILNRFFELNSVENKMQLESESSRCKKGSTTA